jgi:tRNA A37 threonylcarbamoyladenosine modification protein TsaB
LTAAKGLAAATGRSAAAVSNLQALALLGEGERRAAVLDARRGEIFGAVYDAQANLLAGETVAPFGAWLEKLPEWDCSSYFWTKRHLPRLSLSVDSRARHACRPDGHWPAQWLVWHGDSPLIRGCSTPIMSANPTRNFSG